MELLSSGLCVFVGVELEPCRNSSLCVFPQSLEVRLTAHTDTELLLATWNYPQSSPCSHTHLREQAVFRLSLTSAQSLQCVWVCVWLWKLLLTVFHRTCCPRLCFSYFSLLKFERGLVCTMFAGKIFQALLKNSWTEIWWTDKPGDQFVGFCRWLWAVIWDVRWL